MSRSLGRIGIALAVIAGTLVVAQSGANASFHLMKIAEVYAADDSQFVELQMYSGGQTLVNGTRVRIFNAGGGNAGTFTFTSNVSNGQNQSSILVATGAAETEFDIDADLMMQGVIDPAGGKACFGSQFEDIDCASWGSFAADDAQAGDPFGPLTAGSSMTRDISGGSNASQLDAGDDTGDSASDFVAAAPAPRNNAGQTGAQPSPSPSTSASPSPDPSPSSEPSPTPSSSPDPTPGPCDGPASASILVPADSETYGPRFRRLSGSSTCSGTGEVSVSVALRQKIKGGGCRWFDGSDFDKGRCMRKRFFASMCCNEWSYRLPSRLRPSIGTKVSYYTAYARADGESSFERGRNVNRFEVRAP